MTVYCQKCPLGFFLQFDASHSYISSLRKYKLVDKLVPLSLHSFSTLQSTDAAFCCCCCCFFTALVSPQCYAECIFVRPPPRHLPVGSVLPIPVGWCDTKTNCKFQLHSLYTHTFNLWVELCEQSLRQRCQLAQIILMAQQRPPLFLFLFQGQRVRGHALLVPLYKTISQPTTSQPTC